jgi:hypothetical protein
VRELVMVIADLFLGPPGEEAAAQARSTFAQIPGIERIGRFGERLRFAQGWRGWVAAHVGRAELNAVAPACVAAARLDTWQPPRTGACWIATPVHLSAGLTRVHLDHAGLLQLSAAELGELAHGFGRTFGGDDSLVPLPCGQLLLGTPLIAALPTTEPARLAGGIVSQVLPETADAAPLRRLMTECEMWLHGEGLNLTRARRGEPAVTALWPWGAAGSAMRPQARVNPALPAGFGCDAWLDGLWHLSGGECRGLPASCAEVLAGLSGGGALTVLRVADELQAGQDNAVAALARLDERFISPALRALAAGELGAVTLLLNDHGVRVRPHHRLRLWRRRRAGLSGYA